MKSAIGNPARIATLAVVIGCSSTTDAVNSGLDGTYNVTALFDRSPVAAGGTLVFQQVGQTVLVTGSLQYAGLTYTRMSDGSLVGTRLRFIVGNGWRFDGTVSLSEISGRHLFAVFPDSVAGNWTAMKQTGPPPPP